MARLRRCDPRCEVEAAVRSQRQGDGRATFGATAWAAVDDRDVIGGQWAGAAGAA
jgi:hypothetical protein